MGRVALNIGAMSNDFSNNSILPLQGFRLGNKAIFDAIFRELSPALYFYSLQITADKAVSEEIAGEAFVRVWERREKVKDVKAYLYRVVRNLSLDWVKAENKRRMIEQEAGPMMAVPETLAWEAMVKTELLRELRAAIDKLPAQRQRVIKLLYQEGKSVQEVATALNISPRVIREHRKEGLAFLRKIMRLIPLLFLMIL